MRLIPTFFGEEEPEELLPPSNGKLDDEMIIDETTDLLNNFNITANDENHIDDAMVDELMTSIMPERALSVHATLMRSRHLRLNECRQYIEDSLPTILKKQYFVTQASAEQILDIFHRADKFNNNYKALRRVLRKFDTNENVRKAFQEYVSFTLFQTPTFEHTNMQVWLQLLRISHELSNICCEFISKFKLDEVDDLNVVMFFNETHWMHKNQFQIDVRDHLIENAAKLILDRQFEHIQPEAMCTLICEHFDEVKPLKAPLEQLFLGVFRHVELFTNMENYFSSNNVAENFHQTGYMELFVSKMTIFEFLRCIRQNHELFSFQQRIRIGMNIIINEIPAFTRLQLVLATVMALICYFVDIPVFHWVIEMFDYLARVFN